MKILVLGGTYFLGKSFVELAKNDNEITVVNRGNKKIRFLTNENIKEFTADRHDIQKLSKLKGEAFDVLVDFCAYSPGDIRTILEALDGRIRQYIFISTCDVYRRGTSQILDEDAEFEERDFGGEAGAYILGKAALERELEECCREWNVAYTSVRPAFIYGPDNYAPRESMYFNWILQAGQIISPTDSDGFFQMVYVKDLARILLGLCGRREAFNEAYNVCGERIWDYPAFAESLKTATGIEFEQVLLTSADIEGRGIPLPFPLRKEESERYAGEKISFLGVPETPFESGLSEAFAAFKADMLNIDKIFAEVDRFFDENNPKEAEKLLLNTLEQAKRCGEEGLALQVLNELIGYYRMSSEKEKLVSVITDSLELAEKLGLKGTVPFATTALNAANACRSLGELENARKLYAVAQEIYEEKLSGDDMLLAGLFNNKSLMYQEMGDYANAHACLLQALRIAERNNAGFEIAVTYANLANTSVLGNEFEAAKRYAQKAMECFKERNLFDTHYCAALSAMGMCLFREGDYAGAEQYFSEGMELVEKSIGQNSQYERLKENRDECRKHLAGAGKQEESMKGIEICRRYYQEYGIKMIHEKFPEYENRIAVGLVGEGSDCFGFDDEFSRDHDWGPDFCMWVTDEVYETIGKELEEAYRELPEEFQGYRRTKSEQGVNRRGVNTISGFYGRILGALRYEEIDWKNVDDARLAAAVNGEVFRDDEGIFTEFRNRLLEGYPAAIRDLKLAEDMAAYSQNAQYNYFRIRERNDRLTADMVLLDGMRAAMKLLHHMRNQYPPHDKWLLKSLEGVAGGEQVAALLRRMYGCMKEDRSKTVRDLTEELGRFFAMELYAGNDISDIDPYLDSHTEELLKRAKMDQLNERQLVEKIVKLEFEAFDKVKNEGGRAFCQNDWPTFSIMRKSQYMTWNRAMLMQYLYDFDREYAKGHNLITEKYGRMMESTDPVRYAEIRENFPELSEQKKAIIEQIVGIQMEMMEAFAAEYPKLAGHARNLHTYEDEKWDTSYETYLRGEISTYSDKMLQLYGQYVIRCASEKINIARKTIENTVELYGYKSLEELSAKMG